MASILSGVAIVMLLVVVVPQLPSGFAGQCYINSGYDYSQGKNDMQQVIVADLGACCDLCTATTACKAFVWNPADKKCYLKNGLGTTVVSPTLFYGFPDNTTSAVAPPSSCSSGCGGCCNGCRGGCGGC